MEEMAADTVQQVKEKLSIVEVVSPYVKLQKAGRYLRGLSPFTKEKTPSFFVNLERNSYYCFSTGQGGDMFTFIEKMEGVDFKGALKILAEKAGVELVYQRGTGEDKDKLERLRRAMADAVVYFSRNIQKSPALEYAQKRGLTPETIKSWELGFAPDSWRGLLEELQTRGYTNLELVGAGLIKEADGRTGTWYDRFRNRLMFPIRDSAGRTVAFTGRSLDPDDQAKYLNSPETELFKKSEILFGMDRAKDAIRSRGFAILVEGQFDLLLLHQIGFTNTVALSGTALTPQHIALIKRYADNLLLCLDSDRAGLAASAKSASIALAAGMRVKAVRLPEGKDPADIASGQGSEKGDQAAGAKEFAKRVSESQSIVEFFLSVLAASEKDSHKLVLAAERTVLPLIAAIQSPLEREHFITVTARALGAPPDAVRASLDPLIRARTSASYTQTQTTQRNESREPNVVSTERPRSVAEERGIAVRALAACYPNTDLAERIHSEYARIIGTSAEGTLEGTLDPLPERAIFEAGLAYGEQPSEKDVSELVRVFEHAVLTEKLQHATQELRRAEAAQDAAAIDALLATCRDLSKKISLLS